MITLTIRMDFNPANGVQIMFGFSVSGPRFSRFQSPGSNFVENP